MGDKVRVRFAPSPTGALHIGGVRTALFNWLFAQSQGGAFILRIEDTDVARSTSEHEQVILDGLSWLGLSWDEGPYRQSERGALYAEHLDRLKAEGNVYPCYCLPEELEARRKEALAKGEMPRYDRRCRNRTESPDPEREPAWRLSMPKEGSTTIKDLIRGRIRTNNSQLDDFIVLRSDGTPTYNFVVVVDDATMGVTHVIRGEDHLANTPKQYHLYKMLGYPLPEFAHQSLILGPDKGKLSKRHGASSVMEYRETGYLPEALANYLVRLGWSHGDQEIFSREEMIQHFSLQGMTKAPVIYNPEKLLWLNAHYIKQSEPERLASLLEPFLPAAGVEVDRFRSSGQKALRAVRSWQERSRTLVELAQGVSMFYAGDVTYEEEAAAKFLKPELAPIFLELIEKLEALDAFDEGSIEETFMSVVEGHGLKLGKVAQPCRVALTGKTVSPGIYEVIELLGRDLVLARLRDAVGWMEARKDAS
jgi:glutamyl-tRNA synthetase